MNPEQPAKKFYDPITSIVLTIVLFVGAQVLGTLAYGAFLLLLPGYHGLNSDALQQKITEDRWLYLSLVLLIEALTVALVFWFMKRRSIRAREIGMSEFKPNYIMYAVLGYVAALVLIALTLQVVRLLFPGLDLNQKQDLGISTTNVASGGLVPIFITLVILPPLAEEFVMRGFLFSNLRSRLPFVWSSVIVSVLFGLAHINQAANGLFWSGAISFFVLSMVLCYLREKTQSLWPGVGVHMLQNGIAFMALYVWTLPK